MINLMQWPRHLVNNKILKKSGFFFLTYMLLISAFCTFVVITTHQENQMISQYLVFGAGSLTAVASYITLYAKHHEFVKIYWDIFPNLWPLRCAGEGAFNHLRQTGTFAKYFMYLMTILSAVTATLGLPWFGDEYDLYIPIRCFEDHLNKWWSVIFSTIFYINFYHAGFTIISNVFVMMYLALHLYGQLFLLEQQLAKLGQDSRRNDLDNANYDQEYQVWIRGNLILFIQHHRILQDFLNKINELIYFPILYFSFSAVTAGVALVLFPTNSCQSIIRVVFTAILTVLLTATFCFLGQLVENESNAIFYAVSNLPWYLWTVKNQKLVLLFLLNTEQSMILSSSGVITVNYQLLIRVPSILKIEFIYELSFSDLSTSIFRNDVSTKCRPRKILLSVC
ncbi:uncharacterized protein [Tenebrio molitor]|uniref:uncharacterized protein isoform X1 n=1 Tax=Tenebrio molitor TaxID=7067 RepID=UPI0036249E5B